MSTFSVMKVATTIYEHFLNTLRPTLNAYSWWDWHNKVLAKSQEQTTKPLRGEWKWVEFVWLYNLVNPFAQVMPAAPLATRAGLQLKCWGGMSCKHWSIVKFVLIISSIQWKCIYLTFAGKNAAFLRLIRGRSLAEEYRPSAGKASELGLLLFMMLFCFVCFFLALTSLEFQTKSWQVLKNFHSEKFIKREYNKEIHFSTAFIWINSTLRFYPPN